MYKILFALLPFLLACNMKADTETKNQKPETDTFVAPLGTSQSNVEITTPTLQAIQWKGIKEMTDETFKKEVLASSSLTLVDFNATWCGPCKRLKPELEKLVKEYDGKVNFASVDVDACPETAAQYNTSSIPYLLFIQNAKTGSSTVGLQPYESLKEMIDFELKAK